MPRNSALFFILSIGFLAYILPAAAILSESACFPPHHCLQIRSGGLCFFPNPNPPTPRSCNNERLKRALENHIASKSYTPSNAYWDLDTGAFLGDTSSHTVDSLVALCHTGPINSDQYLTICRHAARDNDIADATAMPSCSTVHQSGEAVRRDRCAINQACEMQRSNRDKALEVIAITTAPAAYLEYLGLVFKLVRKRWPAEGGAHAHRDDIEVGVLLDLAHNPIRRVFHLGAGFAAFLTGGRIQGLFDLNNMLIALARVAERARPGTGMALGSSTLRWLVTLRHLRLAPRVATLDV